MGMVVNENRRSGRHIRPDTQRTSGGAEEARAYLNLNEVIFLPAGQPWMKSTGRFRRRVTARQ